MKICDKHSQKIHEEIKKQNVNALRIEYFKKFYKEGKIFTEISPYEEICTNILKYFLVECKLYVLVESEKKLEELCPLCFVEEERKELLDDWIKGATEDCKLYIKFANDLSLYSKKKINNPEIEIFNWIVCPICKSMNIGTNYTKEYYFCEDCDHEWDL